MRRYRTTVNFFLYGTRIFRPARRVFLSLFDRPKLAILNRMRDFYGRFMRKDSLVLDVGANVGDYTNVFLSLGARVIAVEPNPRCAKLIKRMEAKESVYVENVALGNCEGSAELNVCQWYEIITISDDWKRESERSGLLPNCDGSSQFEFRSPRSMH